jgi:D-glycero-alpha-D-manno-heptose-7-phosphate kinase
MLSVVIISQTPLRISLFGGGTDLPKFYLQHGGCVLTTAIDKYVYCVVKERFDRYIYINYSVKEIVEKVDELKHELVREAMKIVGVNEGVEISFLSDIPSSGSGLGSSSSVSVGVLNALYQFTGRNVDAARLAEEACEIEIEKLGKPIGVQDQAIAAFGGVRFIEFSRDGRINVQPLHIREEILDDLGNYMMVFFTGVTRKSESVLTEQKQNIDKKIEILQEMSAQARIGKKLLESGNVFELGKLLDEGWQLKKQLASKISSSEIDDMYAVAKKSGALGGKISGAGGGGFLTLFVPTGKREAVRKSLRGLKEVPMGLSRDGSKIIFNIRR